MTRKVKWGILGASRMARVMLPNILLAENSELVAVASRRPKAAEALVADVDLGLLTSVKCYNDPELLLRDPEVEAVYLPMANEEHGEWGLKVLEHGKHVLIEKPMALKLEEIEAIEELARKRGLKVMEGFMYRFHPQHEQVWRMLDEGLIGEVRTVYATFSFPMVPARLYRISRPVEQGGGALWDVGCYAVHVCRWFFNRLPKQVVGFYKLNEHGADTMDGGVLDFGDGRYAHVHFGFEQARRAEYEIIGTCGGMTCHNVWAKPAEVPMISWWQMNGHREEETLPKANHFKLEVEHFADCIMNDRSPRLSLQDAKENCRVLNALLEAMQAGRVVDV